MAQQVMLEAKTRGGTGKGAARALRRQGQVPAVIYGHGREPEALVIDDAALDRLLASISASTIVDVAVDGRAPVKALIREVQRDPLRPADVLHVDLYEVRADEKISVDVPVHLVGTPEGVRNFGGVLDQVLYTLTIRAYPADVPERIDLDVSRLNIGHVLHVSDVTVERAEILNDPGAPVCSVVAPRTEEAAAPTPEEATAEPELIRKPKAEEEAAEE
ncbi:MAG TPA: 50S ribosomal protein L25 [Gemmatimonadales bacterium]|nr:50S ribosomal protein L25 [Gemmatimonadales bacterium]